MQSSTALQLSCTRGPWQFFLSSEQGGGEGGKGGGRGGGRGGQDQNYNAVFNSNAAELFLWAKAIVSLH